MGTHTPEDTPSPRGGGPCYCTVSAARDSLPRTRKHLKDRDVSGRKEAEGREEGTPLVFFGGN